MKPKIKATVVIAGWIWVLAAFDLQAQSSASFHIRGSAFVNTGQKSASTSFAVQSAMGQGGALGKTTSVGYAVGAGFLRTLSASEPEITPLYTNPQFNTLARLRTVLSDPYGLPETGTFYYRQGGQSAYSSVPMTRAVGDTFIAQIPAISVSLRGLEVYIVASNGFEESLYPRNDAPQNRPELLRVRINANAPATPSGVYRLVSFPLAVSPDSASSQIADNFSLSDPKVARLFWWDPILADTTTTDTTSRRGYREFGSSGFPGFIPGRSMFLGANGGLVYNGTGLSTVPDTAINGVDYLRFPLDSGWNMIANPFAYNLNYDSVSVLASDGNVYPCPTTVGCTNLLGNSGVWNYISGTSYLTKRIMLPWRGYFAFNYDTGRIQVLFPKPEMNIPNPNLRPANEHEIDWPVDWKISITAKSGDLLTPPGVLGTAKNAGKRYDRLDLALPPSLPGDLRVVFEKDKDFGPPGDYLSDIRPALTESESWSFTVAPGSARAIELNFDGLADIPADYDLILADQEGRAKQNLRLEPVYRFIASQNRHFELTIAPKTTGQTALLPTKYDLYQNFPNPFNPQTLIKYDLSEAATVRLEVFNILGQKVATLVNRFEAAGPKSALWDGTDERGAKVSSGIYFYKIAAGDYVATKKMMLVK